MFPLRLRPRFLSSLANPLLCSSIQGLVPPEGSTSPAFSARRLQKLCRVRARSARRLHKLVLFPPGGSKSYAESDLVPPEGSTRSCFFRPYEKSVTIQDFFRPEAPEACLRRPVKLALQLEEYCNGSRSVNLNP